VNRRDKLGHSIPMKNWIRDNAGVQGFFMDHLSKERIEAQGLFNPVYVENMIREHLGKRRNHSHRLWALVILGCWMETRSPVGGK